MFMTDDSLVGKVVLILNQSDLYVGILKSKAPLSLQAPYLQIKKDEDKMAIIPHTKNKSVLEGRISLYNESTLGQKMRFLCYTFTDEDLLRKISPSSFIMSLPLLSSSGSLSPPSQYTEYR